MDCLNETQGLIDWPSNKQVVRRDLSQNSLRTDHVARPGRNPPRERYSCYGLPTTAWVNSGQGHLQHEAAATENGASTPIRSRSLHFARD